MMATDTDIGELELQAYHDGELDAARRLQVEAWLSSHPQDAARVRGWQDIEQRLHSRFDGVLAESMPGQQSGDNSVAARADLAAGRTMDRRDALATRRGMGAGNGTGAGLSGLPGLAQAAALIGLMIGFGLLGWSLHPQDDQQGAGSAAGQLATHGVNQAPASPDATAAAGGALAGVRPHAAQVQADLIHPALFAHQVYAADRQHPVEVPALQRASLNHWVSDRMHTRLSAPDLSAQGLSLLGGRLLPSSNRMAAQFMYQDAQGARTTVYVRRISGAGHSDFQYREQDALHAFYWVSDAMGYAVIGEQPAPQLIAVAGAVQAAFAAGRDSSTQ